MPRRSILSLPRELWYPKSHESLCLHQAIFSPNCKLDKYISTHLYSNFIYHGELAKILFPRFHLRLKLGADCINDLTTMMVTLWLIKTGSYRSPNLDQKTCIASEAAWKLVTPNGIKVTFRSNMESMRIVIQSSYLASVTSPHLPHNHLDLFQQKQSAIVTLLPTNETITPHRFLHSKRTCEDASSK